MSNKPAPTNAVSETPTPPAGGRPAKSNPQNGNFNWNNAIQPWEGETRVINLDLEDLDRQRGHPSNAG